MEFQGVLSAYAAPLPPMVISVGAHPDHGPFGTIMVPSSAGIRCSPSGPFAAPSSQGEIPATLSPRVVSGHDSLDEFEEDRQLRFVLPERVFPHGQYAGLGEAGEIPPNQVDTGTHLSVGLKAAQATSLRRSGCAYRPRPDAVA
jgi:hypothetical protein